MSDPDMNADVSNGDIYSMLAGDILPAHIHARRRAEARKQKIVDAQHRYEKWLEQFPTVKLLDMRSWSTPFVDYVQVEIDADGNDHFVSRHDWQGEDFTEENYINGVAHEAALKAVLNRRPHIPNKVEKQSARRAAATEHHGPKKKGGNKFTNRERAAKAQKLADKQASRRWNRARDRQRSWWRF